MRERIGDREGDTVLGPPGQGGLLTMIDRKSRYLKMKLLPCKEAETVRSAVCRTLSCGLPVRSITFDNGSEFARFREMEKALGPVCISRTLTARGNAAAWKTSTGL